MMISLPQFLLESSICLATFFAFYYLVLRKETFFQLNRAYLLITPLLSAIIPLINIEFSKSTAQAQHTSFDSFLYPALSNANAINELIWERVAQPTPSFSFTIADLILSIYWMGVILMSFHLFKGLWGIFKRIRNNAHQQKNGYTFIETGDNFPAASFFSYIFWNIGNISEEKKLLLEHELVHIRQHHSIDVLLMEIWVILKWYNPLIYYYRKSLKATHEYIADQYVANNAQSIHHYASILVNHSQNTNQKPMMNNFAGMLSKRLLMLGQDQSKYWRLLKYTLALPIVFCMMLLFSCNLAENIQPVSVSKTLSTFENYLQGVGDKTLIEFENNNTPYITWGGVKLPVAQVDDNAVITLENQGITPEAFNVIKSISISSMIENSPHSIQQFSAAFELKDGTFYKCDQNAECFSEYLHLLQTDFTLYLKLHIADSEDYYTSITVSDTPVFYDHTAAFLDLIQTQNTVKKLCYSLDYESWVQLVDLPKEAPQADYHLEWGEHNFQAVKIGAPLMQAIDIQSVTVDEFKKLKEDNFNLVLKNSCLPIDSIFVMVNGEGNNTFRCRDKFSEASCYHSFLYEMEEPGTIYLILKTLSGELFSSIVTVGDESTLYLENENFVNQLLQFPATKFNANNVIYTENNYELMWGDLQFELTRKDIDSRFTGEVEISLENWLKTIEQEPIFGLQRGGLFDEVSFQISTMAKYGKGSRLFTTIVESKVDEPFAYFDNDKLKEFAKEVKIGDIIRLEEISYGEFMPDRVNATIKIVESSAIQQIISEAPSERKNSYQFHWGEIDVKLKANEADEFYSSIEVPINQMMNTFSLEPVLTSRFNGVYDAFGFEMNYLSKENLSPKSFQVKSKTNKPDLYLESIPSEEEYQQYKVGDKVIIKSFDGESIKESLKIEITLTEAKEKVVKTINNNPILDWGGYEFDLQHLNGKSNNKPKNILTLNPELFHNIRCSDPILYYKTGELAIKKASLVVSGKETKETCLDAAWHEDCFQQKMKEAGENAELTLFIKTDQQENFMLRFRLSNTDNSNEVMRFGVQDSSQMILDLMKDYTNNFYDKSEDIGPSFDPSQSFVFWGDQKIEINQVANPDYYGGLLEMDIHDFEKILNKNIYLSNNGKLEKLQDLKIWMHNWKLRESHYIELDCYNGKCMIPFEDIDHLMEKIREGKMNISLFFDNKRMAYNAKLGYVTLKIENPDLGWDPNIRLVSPPKENNVFHFQMINRKGKHTIIRMDTTLQKYQWMYDSYKENSNVEVIHVPDFQTIKRMVQPDEIIKKEEIKRVEVLSNDLKDKYLLAEFYDFEKNTTALKWRDYEATMKDTVYCIDDFIKAENDELAFFVNDKKVPLLQFEMIFVPKEGQALKYISNSTDKKEIKKAVKKMDPRTSIYITDILIEYEGEPILFPLTYVMNFE